MSAWDAGLYLQFANERARPAADLISHIDLRNPAHIIDIGCGPGNSTQMLHERWPQAAVTGVDSSSEMLAKAQSLHPEWKWIQADAATWRTEHSFDLVFSNAALHWVPDHAELFPRLLDFVAPGGVFAVQMPANFHAPAHRIMAEAAQEPLWREALQNASAGIGVESLPFYYDLLQPLALRLDLWETEYLHIMDGPEAILEWIRATGMRPYLQALPDDRQRKQFQDLCLERLRKSYPQRQSGKVLFPFRRIFVIAYRTSC
jgi:trans-aconitate 2-methyltransferase